MNNEFALSPDEFDAYQRICRARWPQTAGAPICPACGAEEPYRLLSRRKYRGITTQTHQIW